MPESMVLEATRPGLTTTEASFIEAAHSKGQLYIQQPYELYSEENQDAWRKLFARISPRWARPATTSASPGTRRTGIFDGAQRARISCSSDDFEAAIAMATRSAWRASIA